MEEKLYNVYVSCQFITYNLTCIDAEALNVVVNAYLKGVTSFTLFGKKHVFNKLHEFTVYSIDKQFIPSEQVANGFILLGEKKYVSINSNRLPYYTHDGLLLYGKNVTFDFIGHRGFGADKNEEVAIVLNSDLYINSERISALEKILSDEFDLTRLNDNYSRGNYFSTGMLLRALLDHIPPIFKHDSFAQLSSQAGNSFKKNMKHLQESFRNIADSILHSPIKRKEVLPTSQQIEFKADVDILLAEIIKILN
jgi:hypothetical protein